MRGKTDRVCLVDNSVLVVVSSETIHTNTSARMHMQLREEGSKAVLSTEIDYTSALHVFNKAELQGPEEHHVFEY